MSVNILLISSRDAHFKKFPHYDYTFPIGLPYISAVLKENGFNVDCLNLNHVSDEDKAILDMLDSKHFDFVGLGQMSMAFDNVKKNIEIVRSHVSNPVVILGGIILSSDPVPVFKSLMPDIGVMGEGEETIVDLIKNFDDLEKVNGIIYLDSDNIIKINPARIYHRSLDDLPLPDYDGFGFSEYLDNLHPTFSFWANIQDYPRMYPILSSRACPYNCTFCYHDGKYRERSIDNVMKELKENIPKYRINIINFYDECFSIKREKVLCFCDEIERLRDSLDWDLLWECQLRVSIVDDDLLKRMYDCGCRIISYGFESADPLVLKSMNKNIKVNKIIEALHLTLSNHIGVQGFFIFGDPAETYNSAKSTIDVYRKYFSGQSEIHMIMPYPGSKIYEDCKNNGVIDDSVVFINSLKDKKSLSYYLNFSGMSDKDLNRLRASLPVITFKYKRSSIPYNIVNDDDIISFDIKCPYCKKINHFVNFVNRFPLGCQCRFCAYRFFGRNLKGYLFYILIQFRPFEYLMSWLNSKKEFLIP